MRLLFESDGSLLLKKLNALGPNFSIVSIYGLNGHHYAWVSETPKQKKKEKDHEK